MNLRVAEFVTSAVKPAQYPALNLPEVALVGRSNVGKSSLINALAGRRDLARTSSQPGRTQTLNFYVFDRAFVLADLPGYGYAQVPKSVRARWDQMIQAYFQTRVTLRGVLHVLDARHAPTSGDWEVRQYVSNLGLPIVSVATKVDKLSRNQAATRVREINQALGQVVIRFSAQTGEGRVQVAEALLALTR